MLSMLTFLGAFLPGVPRALEGSSMWLELASWQGGWGDLEASSGRFLHSLPLPAGLDADSPGRGPWSGGSRVRRWQGLGLLRPVAASS